MFILTLHRSNFTNTQSNVVGENLSFNIEENPDDLLKNILGSSDDKDSANNEGADNESANSNFTLNEASLLNSYLHDPFKYVKLTAKQKKKFDVDGNGKINDMDLNTIYNELFKQIFKKIHLNPRLEGDFNHNGKIDNDDVRYLRVIERANLGLVSDCTVSEELKNAADLDHNGILNQADVDVLKSKIKKPQTPHHHDYNGNLLVGDIDGNGKVDWKDLEKLGKAFNSPDKNDKLIGVPKDIVDVDQNGVIDFGDVARLGVMVMFNSVDSIQAGSSIRGDVNNDGVLNEDDKNALQSAKDLFFHQSLPDDKAQVCDLNGDGTVDITDLNVLRYDIMGEKKPDLNYFNLLPNNSLIDSSFVSQSPSASNTSDETVQLNGDCAAASLLMIARMFDKVGGGPEDVYNELSFMRELMGASPSHYFGVSTNEMVDGAKALGLEAEGKTGNSQDIIKALQEGKKVIVSVNPAAYSPSAKAGHAVVINGYKDGKFEVYNPAFAKPIFLTEQELDLAMSDFGNQMAVIGESNQNGGIVFNNQQSNKGQQPIGLPPIVPPPPKIFSNTLS